ncbi:hypothetical protein FisN_7Lu064 [Fistulifera solaris]|uniref:guanylate cyclase n=1 Tax=Fistulifera solaris TaxID=1519565 RepID=A0A1Z5JCG8_FISSO|nr:hypothetical protein FisN_7Lu064 [Fistulifera solaris]|eukprot:GAX11694.1 hypothetical protein FisN_7Lu064 [Fistulifera solaris]
MPAAQVFDVEKRAAAVWSSIWLRKQEDQALTVKPTMPSAQKLVFKGSAIRLDDRKPADWIVILCPDVNNLNELRDMVLTLSDLPVHGSHRDGVFLREHLSGQMNDALKVEKLSKSLQKEKKLIESLLPEDCECAECRDACSQPCHRLLFRQRGLYKHLRPNLSVGGHQHAQSALLHHGLLGHEVQFLQSGNDLLQWPFR